MPRFSVHSGILHSMYDELVKPVVLTVMGKYTIGKKTFINSFIGEDILKSNAKYGNSYSFIYGIAGLLQYCR